MPKQSLNEVKSSPLAHGDNNNDDNNIDSNTDTSNKEREAVAIAFSAPAFYEDNLHYHFFSGNYAAAKKDEEIQDKRCKLFRNRLFSTWIGQQPPPLAPKVRDDEGFKGCDNGSAKRCCWQDGRQSTARRKQRNGCGSQESVMIAKSSPSEADQDGDEDGDVDGGYAWVILIVIFVINASTFGAARAYGLIFENSARRDEQSRSEAALPFTTMGAVENMAGPLTGYLLARTGSWRVVVLSGSCLITLSHLLAAYFDSQWGQILTIGLMCGVGQSFISISSFQINNAYFVRYRSRAFGIGLTGAAVGTFYISPLCQFVLDNHTKSLCYLMLGLILLPNVPLALLLKPKRTPNYASDDDNDRDLDHSAPAKTKSSTTPRQADCQPAGSRLTAAVVAAGAAVGALDPPPPPAEKRRKSRLLSVFSISDQLLRRRLRKRDKEITQAVVVVVVDDGDGGDGGDDDDDEEGDSDDDEGGFWTKVGQVLSTPLFHLIWPTQLLFCWLNFVFGMIITDFGKDRGLNETQNSHLIVIWASGQLFGRLCLGSLVDLRILSYKSFTMVCFASISLITLMLNNFGLISEAERAAGEELTSNLICLLVFILSMFISTLYILFNGLVVNYMDKSLTALSVGISSFTGSFFLLPRASIIGYYRDTCGNYDAMLTMFTCVTMFSALIWLLLPGIFSYARRKRHHGDLSSSSSSLDNCHRTGSRGISQVNGLLDDLSLRLRSSRTISPDDVEQCHARPDNREELCGKPCVKDKQLNN